MTQVGLFLSNWSFGPIIFKRFIKLLNLNQFNQLELAWIEHEMRNKQIN